MGVPGTRNSSEESCKQIQPKREAMWDVTSKAQGQGWPSPLEFTSCHSVPQKLEMELWGLVFVLLDLGLAFIFFLVFGAISRNGNVSLPWYLESI